MLTVYLQWVKEDFLEKLHQLKGQAQLTGREVPVSLEGQTPEDAVSCNMQTSGAGAWAYRLESAEYTLCVGTWANVISRPNVKIEVRSETLWRLGARRSVERIVGILKRHGASVGLVKVSRADLCADVLLPETSWREDLRGCLVSRASDIEPRYSRREFSGFSLGKGAIVGRLYNKPKEIAEKSFKEWMYPIWGVEAVPEGYKIVRVEYQLRREALKELGVDVVDDLWRYEPNIWAYCCQNWLTVKDNPGAHHTQRNLLDWWEVVQNGYKGAQGAWPQVRAKAVKANLRALLQQWVGLTGSIAAVIRGENPYEKDGALSLDGCIQDALRLARVAGLTDELLMEKVRLKDAKYRRGGEKYRKAVASRPGAAEFYRGA
ncbi:MAG: hypothetical protein LLG01_00495 [Planctomycetaceae bacterium]|nr:hypothetical protein [Planctomycetaceae bacterium]